MQPYNSGNKQKLQAIYKWIEKFTGKIVVGVEKLFAFSIALWFRMEDGKKANWFCAAVQSVLSPYR